MCTSYDQCGCVSPEQWSARAVVLPGTTTIIKAPFCSTSDTCFSNASTRISTTTSIMNQYCSECYQECSTTSFAITTSSIGAPSTLYRNASKAFVESSLVPLPINWTTNWMNEIQNNYISLEVVCESSQVERFTQEASIDAVDLLSSVGGHTGLWIGISFLSLMELFEIFYCLLRNELFNVRTTLGITWTRNNGYAFET